jgi:heptosyltransferase-2
VRAVRSHYDEVALFVASGSRSLANFLFPDIPEMHSVDLRHLSRNGEAATSPDALVEQLNRFDQVLCLRDDPVMRTIVARLKVPYVVASGSHLVHETSVQKRAVEQICGHYSRTRLFSGLPHEWPVAPRHVALCIASGFPTNRWAQVYWVDLAHRLAAQNITVTLIGGPIECDELHVLSGLLRRVPHDILIGSSDFAGFLDALDPIDIVIATDGGTAHICSLRKPVCSIFGSSPWRRYAPFGRSNVVVTRDELCSPCVQLSSAELNGCVTRECMARLHPTTIMQVISSNGFDFSTIRGVRAERGISHRYEL